MRLPSQIVFAFLVVAACSKSATSPAAAPDPWKDARDFVTASLKDPESARFGALRHGKGTAICGQVNAKNSFGGYVGMTAFVYAPDEAGSDRLIIYDPSQNWGAKGIDAQWFIAHGCSIGADEAQALTVRAELDKMNRQIDAEAAAHRSEEPIVLSHSEQASSNEAAGSEADLNQDE